MEDQTEIFRHWLRKIIKKDKRISGVELAKLVKCDPSTISSYVRFRTRPTHDVQEKIKARLNATDQEVVEQGTAEMKATKDPPAIGRRASDTNNIAVLSEHQIMVTRFKDPARGKEINDILLKIEEIAPEVLDELRFTLRERLAYLEETRSRKHSGPQEGSSSS